MHKGWTLIVTFVKRGFTFACTYVYCKHTKCSHFTIPSCDPSGCCAKPSSRQIAIYFCWNRVEFDNLSDFAPTPLVLALQRKISYMEKQLYHQISMDVNLNVLKVWDRFKVFEFIFDPFSHGEDSPGIWTRFRKGHFVSENPCLSISCFPLYSYITSKIYVICFILSNEYSYIHTFSEHGG